MQKLDLSSLSSTHIDELSSLKNEPSWLKEYRKNSLSIYQSLPLETSPLYNKYTDAKRMDPEQVSLLLETDNIIPEFLKKRLDELKNHTSAIQIGSNVSINISDELKSQGLVVSSIYDALKDHNDLVQKTLESTNSNEDKFTALNNAAFNSGIFVHVPKNLILEKPIHILSCLSQDEASTISRNMIITEESSKVSIVQELYAPKASKQHAYLELLNTDVSENSQLDVTTLQIMDQSAVNFSTRLTNIGQDSKVNWYLGLFGAMLSRYRIDYYLNGAGSSVNDSEIVFGNNEQSFDLCTNVNHCARATEAKVIEKSILKNKSKSLFKGMIRINENASKAQSFLSGRSILLDKGAKSDSIPGLEIFTNDVRATHSASVAQIDEEQIFYLGTRCLSKAEAERIIIEGFLEPLSRNMSIQVRAWIAYLIESKWENRELLINTDEQLKAIVEVEETRYSENAEIEQHYKYR